MDGRSSFGTGVNTKAMLLLEDIEETGPAVRMTVVHVHDEEDGQ